MLFRSLSTKALQWSFATDQSFDFEQRLAQLAAFVDGGIAPGHPLAGAQVAPQPPTAPERFLLGAGAGWMKDEFDIYGVDFASRGRRMDESIDVMRKLWAGGYAEHHGEFFDFPPMQVSPAPAAPVPILLGGAAPRAQIGRAHV